MKRTVVLGLFAALLLPYTVGTADAAPKKKKQSMARVAGFVQTTSSASDRSLLRPHQRTSSLNRVAGNSQAARFFFYQQIEGR
jgi:hypothetical protein